MLDARVRQIERDVASRSAAAVSGPVAATFDPTADFGTTSSITAVEYDERTIEGVPDDVTDDEAAGLVAWTPRFPLRNRTPSSPDRP